MLYDLDNVILILGEAYFVPVNGAGPWWRRVLLWAQFLALRDTIARLAQAVAQNPQWLPLLAKRELWSFQ